MSAVRIWQLPDFAKSVVIAMTAKRQALREKLWCGARCACECSRMLSIKQAYGVQ
jgi:hypothetical protein